MYFRGRAIMTTSTNIMLASLNADKLLDTTDRDTAVELDELDSALTSPKQTVSLNQIKPVSPSLVDILNYCLSPKQIDNTPT